jgi:hypothetical protein
MKERKDKCDIKVTDENWRALAKLKIDNNCDTFNDVITMLLKGVRK